MCHVAQATSEYLCGQLLAVTIDLADSIVTVCRLVGHGARLDYIIAAGVALLLSDLGTLLEQEFDLLLKTVGVSPDLSQLLALEILQQFEGSNTVVIGAVVLTLETNLHDTAVSGAAAEHEGPVQKFLEGLDAGRRQIYLQRHVLTTAKQVEQQQDSDEDEDHRTEIVGLAPLVVQHLPGFLKENRNHHLY